MAPRAMVPPMDTYTPPSLQQELSELGLGHEEIRRHLTPMMSVISSLIGLEATITIIDRLGGRQIHLSADITENNALAKTVGMKNACIIVEHFGDAGHVVINNPFSQRTLTRLKGMKMLREGKSLNEVAHALRVGRNTVRGWKATDAGTARSRPAAAAKPATTLRPKKAKSSAPDDPVEQRKLAFEMFRKGKSVKDVCAALIEDADTVRKWQRLFEDGK